MFVCFSFNLKIFQGNHDRYTVATEVIDPPIIAQYVRVKPKTWNGFICMRMEFYGCTEGKRALPVVMYDGILINRKDQVLCQNLSFPKIYVPVLHCDVLSIVIN